MDDILTSVGEHNHLLRPLAPDHRLILFLVRDRSRTNLGATRASLAELERGPASQLASEPARDPKPRSEPPTGAVSDRLDVSDRA